jgi:hypothetical protein
MRTDEDLPIRHLCTLISRLPARVSEELVAMACLAVSARHRPTGVATDPDRPIGDLVHSQTLNDLAARVAELVDDMGMDQRFLVMGLVSFLEAELAEWADAGSVVSRRADRMDEIGYWEEMLAQPEDRRRQPMADAEIRNLIHKLQPPSADEEEEHRKDAARALDLFREWKRDFSEKFWALYQIRRKKYLARSYWERGGRYEQEGTE